ncbi:hypothetical protein Ancab_038043 [Ancistrocladus abbreviatus]
MMITTDHLALYLKETREDNGSSFGLLVPKRFTIEAFMCLAGDGGGKGLLKNLIGIDLAREGETPGGSGLVAPWGYGLGHGLLDDDQAGEFFTDGMLTHPFPDTADDGNGD